MQQNNIDLDQINDLDKLKALAFDEIQMRDLASANLNKIAARMQVVAAEQNAPKPDEGDKAETAAPADNGSERAESAERAE